jgi:hypothetical protein
MIRILWEDSYGSERVSNAMIVNVSANGVKLRLDEKISVRSYVACNDVSLGIVGRASVRYCIFSKGKYEIGLEFVSGSDFSKGKPWSQVHTRRVMQNTTTCLANESPAYSSGKKHQFWASATVRACSGLIWLRD